MRGRGPFPLMNRFVNPVVLAVLRSPAHGLLSRRLVAIEVTGRRSGHRFTLPAGYERTGPSALRITVGAPEAKLWWRNLEEPAPVTVILRGERRRGTGRVEREGEAVRVALELDPGS